MADVAELRALQQAVERVGPAAETELANDILEHGLSRHPAAAAAESQASLLRRVDAVRRVMQKHTAGFHWRGGTVDCTDLGYPMSRPRCYWIGTSLQQRGRWSCG